MILAATILHWFNPVVYLMAKAAAVQCEISCDALVLDGADFQQRKQYGETIISIVRNGGKLRTALSTNFYGGKKGMKNRISSIMDTKRKKAGVAILCAVVVATFGAGAIFAADSQQDATGSPELVKSDLLNERNSSHVNFTRFAKSDTWQKNKLQWLLNIDNSYWQALYDQNYFIIAGNSQGSKVNAAIGMEYEFTSPGNYAPSDSVTILSLYSDINSIKTDENNILVTIESKGAGYDAIYILNEEMSRLLHDINTEGSNFCKFVFTNSKGDILYEETVFLSSVALADTNNNNIAETTGPTADSTEDSSSADENEPIVERVYVGPSKTDENVRTRFHPIHGKYRLERTDPDTGKRQVSIDDGSTWLFYRDNPETHVSEISADGVTWHDFEAAFLASEFGNCRYYLKRIDPVTYQTLQVSYDDGSTWLFWRHNNETHVDEVSPDGVTWQPAPTDW